MKNILLFSIFLFTFASQDLIDCSSHTEKQSKIKESKNTAHARNGVSPLIPVVTSVSVESCAHAWALIFHCSNFNLEEKMQDSAREKGFERGEVSSLQAAALSQYLQFVARELPETITLFDELFVAYLGSDFCSSQGEMERSNTGFHFFKLRAFLLQLHISPSPNQSYQGGERV